MGLRRYPLAPLDRAIRSGPMSDTSSLLLVIMAAVLVSMVLAIVIVRRYQVRASRALPDLRGAPLSTSDPGIGMWGVAAPPLRGTSTLPTPDPHPPSPHGRPETPVTPP